ncbi:unnamed protein product, partial [Prorocentrum cordatum]
AFAEVDLEIAMRVLAMAPAMRQQLRGARPRGRGRASRNAGARADLGKDAPTRPAAPPSAAVEAAERSEQPAPDVGPPRAEAEAPSASVERRSGGPASQGAAESGLTVEAATSPREFGVAEAVVEEESSEDGSPECNGASDGGAGGPSSFGAGQRERDAGWCDGERAAAAATEAARLAAAKSHRGADAEARDPASEESRCQQGPPPLPELTSTGSAQGSCARRDADAELHDMFEKSGSESVGKLEGLDFGLEGVEARARVACKETLPRRSAIGARSGAASEGVD